MYIISPQKSSGLARQPDGRWPHDRGLGQDDVNGVLAGQDHVIAVGGDLAAAAVGQPPELGQEALQGIGQLLAGTGWHGFGFQLIVMQICAPASTAASISV